jgi:transcriptional regulator GlxA family with amidase domain
LDVKRNFRAAADAYLELCIRLGTPPQVRELARYLALSPSAVSKRFRALYGELPGAYMKRRQLAIAIQLLRTTHLSVAIIAMRAGFGSRETLFRTFRRLLRLPPSAFRLESNVTSHRPWQQGRLRRPTARSGYS